jgi:DNA-binding response OmpR family regulator
MNSASTPDISCAKREDYGPGSKRILIADDDSEIRECIALLLSHTGFKVETVQDGEEGWRAVRRAEFDLLITDHQMPNMTGLNLIMKIREASIGAPCILISGDLPETESALMPLIRPGAILTKPFEFAALIALVQSLLRKDAPQGALEA